MSARRLIALALAAALASGCAKMTESELRARGKAERDIVAAAQPAHCYTSLAAKDCYAAPIPGRAYHAHPGQAPVAQATP